jgi:hypothetical protein
MQDVLDQVSNYYLIGKGHTPCIWLVTCSLGMQCSDNLYREVPRSKVARITRYPNYDFRCFPLSPVYSEYQKSVKGKVIPVHIMKVQRGSGGIAPLILSLGNRWRCVSIFTPLPLYPRERCPGTHRIGG